MWKKALWATALLTVISAPGSALACACGCGVFDVGTGSMLPTESGGTVWLEYDYLNQSQNWSGIRASDRNNNTDKQLRSDFLRAGGEYMFNRDWGVMGVLPYTYRNFKTATDDDDPTGATSKFAHGGLGDVHLQGVYSGFDDDMSSGVTFGLKLPTGSFEKTGFDRDTQLGTGSTDLLLGYYHVGPLLPDRSFDWFTDGQYERAMIIQNHYRPGDEFDVSVGSYYNGIDFGDGGKIAPLLQLLGSYRIRDAGQNADPDNTGYTRLLISPGVEYDINQFKVYGDVEFPIYQNVNGQQLTPAAQFKLVTAYNF